MNEKAKYLDLQRSLGAGKTVIGIDIGASSVNVAQTAMYKGKPTVIKAVIENIESSTDPEKKNVTLAALKKALSYFNTANADVVCTMSNQKTIVDYIAMPMMPSVELHEAIKIEVGTSQQFSIENPVFDHQVVGRVSEDNVEKNNVMVAVVSQSSIDSLLSYFKPLEKDPFRDLKKYLPVQDFMGLNLVKIIPISIAIENILKGSKTKVQETIVTLEMGSISAELNIYHEGHLEYSRKINVTGLDLTRCLTNALSTNMGKIELTMQEAEWVKKEFGIPSPSEEYLIKGKITANQAISLLRPKLEALIKEITRTFNFYYDKHRDGKINRLVLWGGGAKLKRLPEFLNSELGLPVTMEDPLEDVGLLYEGALDDLEDKQRITLAIGASLSESKGINLLPANLRDSRKKLAQMFFMGILGVGLVLVSLSISVLLLLQLNRIQQDSDKLKNEYQSIKPVLEGVKERLLIQKLANHRFDMGGVLRELSYLPGNVYVSNLALKDGDFTISGFVLAENRECKRLLKPLITELKKTSLSDVKISNLNKDMGDNNKSNFTIEGTLDSGSGE